MSVTDGMRLVISGGVVIPDNNNQHINTGKEEQISD